MTDTSQAQLIAGQERAEAAAGQREFNSELAPFCETLRISHSWIKYLPTPTFLMLINMRLFKLLTTKLKELDARIAQLEAEKEPRQ